MKNSTPTEPIVYTRPAAAKVLTISVRKLDDLIATKEIKPTRIGGRVVIPATEILRIAHKGTGGGIGPRESFSETTTKPTRRTL